MGRSYLAPDMLLSDWDAMLLDEGVCPVCPKWQDSTQLGDIDALEVAKLLPVEEVLPWDHRGCFRPWLTKMVKRNSCPGWGIPEQLQGRRRSSSSSSAPMDLDAGNDVWQERRGGGPNK